MKLQLDWIGILVFSVFIFTKLESSTCFSIQPSGSGLSIEDLENVLHRTRSNRQSEETPEITLIGFLQSSVGKYGEKRVAAAIHDLSQRSMYDLVWLLAGDLEPWLVFDFYKVYAHASADQEVLSVYERFKAGTVNRTIVPEVFALDRKYSAHEWWKRVRTRMLDSVDKYIDGSLKVNSNPPPKLEFTPDGKPIVAIPGLSSITSGQAQATVPKATTTTEEPTELIDPDDEDTDTEDSDLLAALIG